MQIFEKIITVLKEDLDQLNHVNNVRYVQWVQDVAEAHWLQNATTDILNHFFWVLVHHEISYKSPSFLGDQILIKTFVLKSEGVFSIRQVDFINIDTNKTVVSSITKWCLLSKASKKPTRITSEISHLFD